MNILKKFSLLIAIFTMALSFSTNANAAKQCIYNNSGASINVIWHNSAGKIDKNASNENLTAGFAACQDNRNLGYATFECNGCKVATQFAKAATGIAGGVVIVGCILASGGLCAEFAEDLIQEVRTLIDGIKNGDQKKHLVVAKSGQTIRINGNAVSGLTFQ